MWNNFADYSMEVVGASDLLDEIFSNKLIKLFILVSCVLIYLYLLENSSKQWSSQ